MKLKCVSPSGYTNAPMGLRYEAGEVFNATAEQRRFLMSDAPGSFEDYIEKEVKSPPKDKAVKKAPSTKARGG